MENIEKEIIDKLNELRLSRGISVYRLAELTGINQSTLANTFSRRTVPSVINLKLMCEAMDLTLSQFFNDGENVELLSNEEEELISYYRQLSKKVKQQIISLLKSLSEKE